MWPSPLPPPPDPAALAGLTSPVEVGYVLLETDFFACAVDSHLDANLATAFACQAANRRRFDFSSIFASVIVDLVNVCLFQPLLRSLIEKFLRITLQTASMLRFSKVCCMKSHRVAPSESFWGPQNPQKVRWFRSGKADCLNQTCFTGKMFYEFFETILFCWKKPF